MQIRAIKPPSCGAARHDAAIERIIQYCTIINI